VSAVLDPLPGQTLSADGPLCKTRQQASRSDLIGRCDALAPAQPPEKTIEIGSQGEVQSELF